MQSLSSLGRHLSFCPDLSEDQAVTPPWPAQLRSTDWGGPCTLPLPWTVRAEALGVWAEEKPVLVAEVGREPEEDGAPAWCTWLARLEWSL